MTKEQNLTDTEKMRYKSAKYIAHLADKNSRTMVKVTQLLELVQQPNYQEIDPKGYIIRRADKLRKRINRRLVKLARWADITPEERYQEFRANTRPQNAQTSQNMKGNALHPSQYVGKPPQAQMARNSTYPATMSAPPRRQPQPIYSTLNPQRTQLESAVVNRTVAFPNQLNTSTHPTQMSGMPGGKPFQQIQNPSITPSMRQSYPMQQINPPVSKAVIMDNMNRIASQPLAKSFNAIVNLKNPTQNMQ